MYAGPPVNGRPSQRHSQYVPAAILARAWRLETVYECTFRGNTLVDISPRDDSPTNYPLYLRDHLKRAGPAPMKTVTRFAAEPLIRW